MVTPDRGSLILQYSVPALRWLEQYVRCYYT